MKTREDFCRDYGEADEAFRRCIRRTLTELEQKEERPVKRIRWSAALAAAIVLAMTMAVAAAVNQWGIMDFLKYVSRPEAKDMVQQIDGATAETEQAVFTLREAYYDGYGLYLTVNAKPKAEGVMMLPSGMRPDFDYGSTFTGTGDLSVEEWMKEKGLTEVVRANVKSDYLGFSQRFHAEEDGSLTIMLSTMAAELGDDEELVWLTCESGSSEDMTFTVKKNAPEERRAVGETPVACEELGMTIEAVRLISTPLAVYYEIDIDAEWFNTRNENDELISCRVAFDDGEGQIRQTSAVALMITHDRIERGRNLWRLKGTLAADTEFRSEELTLRLLREVGYKLTGEEATVTVKMKEE